MKLKPLLRKWRQRIYLVVTVIMVTLSSTVSLCITEEGVAEILSGHQNTLFYEGFENWNNNGWVVEANLSGTYAIAEDYYIEGKYSFQAGPSTCISDCWDNRVTITKLFSPPLSAAGGKLSFYLTETSYNSWGGNLNVWVNGNKVQEIHGVGTSWNKITVDISEDISIIAFELWDQTNTNKVYLDNISVFSNSSITPTPVPTPTPCEPKKMTADSKKMQIALDAREQETITITCEDGIPVIGEQVTWKIITGKKYISIIPQSAVTDALGRAAFIIEGIKEGKAIVKFKSGGLKVKVKMKVAE